METLLSFIKSLDATEIKGFRSYMKKQFPSSKGLKLFELLLGDVSDKDSISYRIYNTSSGPKLDMLCRRLMAKLEEYLISDGNIEGQGKLDVRVMYEIKAKKKLAFIHYIHRTKGSSRILYEVLDELIEYSKEYEIYKVLTEAYRIKMHLKGLRDGEEEFKRLELLLHHYSCCDHALTIASNCYHQLAILRRFNPSIPPLELQKRLLGWISELKGLYKETGATIVNYYLKMLEADYYESTGEFDLAKEAVYAKRELILNCKSLYIKSRVTLCNGQIAAFDIQLGNYENALKVIRQCIEDNIEFSFNYYVANKLLFYSLFYLKRFEEAFETVTKMLNTSSPIDSNFKNATHLAFSCFTCFAQQNYIAVINELNKNLELSKDKTGWEIAIRVLLIMGFVELDRFDEASIHIERLRKHIGRYGKIEFVTERDKAIVKLLQALDSNGFQFDLTQTRISGLMKKLEYDESCKWKRLTPELIPFHEWVKSKAK